jgi:hypothetical protein
MGCAALRSVDDTRLQRNLRSDPPKQPSGLSARLPTTAISITLLVEEVPSQA